MKISARLLAFSLLVVFAVTGSLSQAKNVGDFPCTDGWGNDIPGFVQPACDAERLRMEENQCNLGCTDDELNALEKTSDLSQGCIPSQPNQDCADIREDFMACIDQCIPSVTNGNILPGPKSAAVGKSYLLESFLPNITNAFLVFNMVIAVLFLVVSGIMWILASGSEEMKERAKNTIVWAIVGLTVSILAYVLVQFVININFFA